MTGRQKCEFLKRMRGEIAEMNGLEQETRECSHEAECSGTCPQCDREVQELMAQLRELGENAKLDDLKLPVGDSSSETESKSNEIVMDWPVQGNISDFEGIDISAKLLMGRIINSDDDNF